MTQRLPPGSTKHMLALICLGVTVIALAFTLRPTHISSTAFWAVLSAGILATVLGVAAPFLPMPGGSRHSRATRRRKRHLVAVECDRFSDSLRPFVITQERAKPRPRPFGNDADRLQRWREEVRSRYRTEFRTWGMETFDAAAELGGVAKSSRSLVENPSPEHLPRLLELFQDAARSLERA